MANVWIKTHISHTSPPKSPEVLKVSLFRKQIGVSQILPKNEWTNLFCLLFYSSRQTNQIHPFVFGESTARQSAFRFYLTFSVTSITAFTMYCEEMIPYRRCTTQTKHACAIDVITTRMGLHEPYLASIIPPKSHHQRYGIQ